MDTPTTVILGATAGAALLSRKTGAVGVAVFAAGALLPDLDGLLLDDTLSYIRLHRSVSHSIVGAVAGALLLAGAARLFVRRIGFPRLFAIALGGIAVAIGTDLATWWGTQILWPFSRARVGVGLVFIIDLWLAAFVTWPFAAWGVQRLRRRPFPLRAFRVAAAMAVAWFLLLFACHLTARSTLLDLCEQTGSRPVVVLPQPFSPFRWSLVSDEGDRYRVAFVDFLRGRQVLEERVFGKGDGGPAALTDATETGRTILWFHRVPVREARALPGGRTEVVYRDLAYEIRPSFDRPPPFRYRFVLEGGRVMEEGWIGR